MVLSSAVKGDSKADSRRAANVCMQLALKVPVPTAFTSVARFLLNPIAIESHPYRQVARTMYAT